MAIQENSSLEKALDNLADMGLSALVCDVVEPVCAAMMGQAKAELSSEAGAKVFVSDYWSFVRAVAHAFDEPQIAAKSAAMFFDSAPKLCSAWSGVETIDGRPRLKMSSLKSLVEAAAATRDGNSGAYSSELIAAMVARQTDSGELAVRSALDKEAPMAPKVFEVLDKEVSASYVWPVDAECDALLDKALARASQESSFMGLDRLQVLLDGFEEVSERRGNHALSCAFTAKFAASAARCPGALGLGQEGWERVLDAMIDAADEAAIESGVTRKERKKTLEKFDMAMLGNWKRMNGGARERLASEIILGAMERSHAGEEEEAADLMGFMKNLFWGRGDEIAKPNQEKFKDMASALCNRLCRDGAVACLAPKAAQLLYDGMATYEPAMPKEWSAMTNPKTVQWLRSAHNEPVEPSAGQWRQLAALARLGELGLSLQAEWSREIEQFAWRLPDGQEELRDAKSAKDIAKGLGNSQLGRAIEAALTSAGVPDGDSLGRLQDLLGHLSDLGASDSSCDRAQRAMSEALAVLEHSELASAMSAEELAGESAPTKKAPRL